MIQFNCPSCDKTFSVDDRYAGWPIRCNGCGNAITIPTPNVPINKIAINFGKTQGSAEKRPQPKMSPRTRRLMADAEHMRRTFEGFPLIRLLSSTGNPPEEYQIEYRIRGLARGTSSEPIVRQEHIVQIILTSDYPLQSPKCKMLTPVFHPNFDQTVICVADHWSAGERLVDLVIRIGEMIAYQAYNIKSPLDGEAAMWADLNAKRLPIDSRDLYPPNCE